LQRKYNGQELTIDLYAHPEHELFSTKSGAAPATVGPTTLS